MLRRSPCDIFFPSRKNTLTNLLMISSFVEHLGKSRFRVPPPFLDGTCFSLLPFSQCFHPTDIRSVSFSLGCFLEGHVANLRFCCRFRNFETTGDCAASSVNNYVHLSLKENNKDNVYFGKYNLLLNFRPYTTLINFGEIMNSTAVLVYIILPFCLKSGCTVFYLLD